MDTSIDHVIAHHHRNHPQPAPEPVKARVCEGVDGQPGPRCTAATCLSMRQMSRLHEPGRLRLLCDACWLSYETCVAEATERRARHAHRLTKPQPPTAGDRSYTNGIAPDTLYWPRGRR
jgi:hypothetical protein